MGAFRIGDVLLLTVGCTVWSKERRDANDDKRGGLIVAVELEANEDGETIRTFVCCDPHLTRPLRFVKLAEDEVDISTAEGPEDGRAKRMLRRFAEELCRVDKWKDRTGPFDTYQAALADYVRELRAVLIPTAVPHLGSRYRRQEQPSLTTARAHGVHPGLIDE